MISSPFFLWFIAALLPALPALPTYPADSPSSDGAISALANYLKTPRKQRADLSKLPFSSTAMTKKDAITAGRMLWNDHVSFLRKARRREMQSKVLRWKKWEMPFDFQVFGKKPAAGRSLYISLHGGGGTAASVNDRQWENQKRLYRPQEGVYLAPRAPTNTWNLWHQAHIDVLLDRLIEMMIAFHDVDPDRVYLMGYSAGGDGVYQLAPRMADRFAAASMMAGHPNDASPEGLRNLPFSLHVGADDRAYQRNQIAEQWKQRLGDLQGKDPRGYRHLVKIYAGKGHWLDREDAAAVPWMAKFRRILPQKIVWKQDDITHGRFYWLAVPKAEQNRGALVQAQRNGQRISVESLNVQRLVILINDEVGDLDRPVLIVSGETVLFQGLAPRTIASLAQSLEERGDPESIFSCRLPIKLPNKPHTE